MKANKTYFTSLIALSLSMFVSITQGETLTLETLPKAKGVAQHAGTPSQLHVATDKGLYVRPELEPLLPVQTACNHDQCND